MSFVSLGLRKKKDKKSIASTSVAASTSAAESGAESSTFASNMAPIQQEKSYGTVVVVPEYAEIATPPTGLAKTKSSSMLEDLANFEDGTIPQSFVVALVIGIICGVAAWIYYAVLWGLLKYIWHTVPTKFIIGVWPEYLYVLWIPIVGILMALGLGFTVKYLGEPGDLALTVKAVHEKAYLPMDHCMPMVYASQFSILGGGSLGPEAPLVAICACLGGWVSRSVFKRTHRNTVRKHTLMGMAGALGAFFGCPLGGSLFALEVNSRFGIEYFEHMVEAIFCGEVTLAVFRTCAGLPIAPIWDIANPKLDGASGLEILAGGLIGLLGASVATLFAKMHWKVMDFFKGVDLMDNDKAPQRALVGAFVIISLGMLIPQTLFWGEYEFQTIATMAPASDLAHIWPTTGLFGFEMETGFHALIVGLTKLVAISFTVSGGYRGGFIFPFFACGAALGRFVHMLVPAIPIPICCLAFAAGINVGITRTSLATPIILCFLAGEPNAMASVLAASLISLFATTYMPFIKTQVPRTDMNYSMYSQIDLDPAVEAHEDTEEEEETPDEDGPLIV
jgi:H+/Cl- antiporter ClcA